ncbi:hypothetical protein BT69DRAFT_817476 [Atractiella rhizophila]|nr:hypothetical protein BT69DRAFT_817476 [Atractiella rhizophila]
MNLPEPKNIDEVLQQLEMVGCSRFRTSKHTLPPGARERCLRTWVPPIRHGASSRYSTAPNSSRQSGTYSQVERDAAAQLAALPHTRPGRSSSMSTSSQGSGSTVTGVPGTASAGLTYQRASPGSSGSSSRATTTNNRAASPARRWGTSSNTSSSSSHRNSAPDGGLGSDGAGGLPGVSFPPTMDEGPTYRSSSPDLAVNPKRLSQMSLEDEPTGDGNVQSNSRMSIANLTNPIDLSQAQGQVGGGQRERRLSSSEMAAIRYKEELEKRRRSRGL